MPAETATSSPTPPSSEDGNRISPGLALVGIIVGVLMLGGDYVCSVVLDRSITADLVRLTARRELQGVVSRRDDRAEYRWYAVLTYHYRLDGIDRTTTREDLLAEQERGFQTIAEDRVRERYPDGFVTVWVDRNDDGELSESDPTNYLDYLVPLRLVLQYGGMTVIGISLIAMGLRD